MTRRKSACSKWTLVLLIVVLCPFVFSRPQEASSAVSVDNVDKPTETPIRYRYRNISLSHPIIKTPIDISNVNNSYNTHLFSNSKNRSNTMFVNPLNGNNNIAKENNTRTNRRSRLISKSFGNSKNTKNNVNKLSQIRQPILVKNNTSQRKPAIRKVLTKWTDNTKYEDIDFSYETIISTENDRTSVFNEDSTEVYSIEDSKDMSTEHLKKLIRPKPIKNLVNKIKNKVYKKPSRPEPDYSDGAEIYSDNIQVTAGYPYQNTHPIYIFTTPTPTPIITNVGNPKPWIRPTNIQANYHLTPTTQRPVIVTKPLKKHHNYHNSVYNNHPQHPGHEYEVSTFQPTDAYTDRIVIRPEEYSGSPDECPTIFLTLNNTFQGQGKEACPDLNIAVNTNVINKNVVVESEEEENDDGIFSDPFGIPFGDESGDETGHNNGIFDSEENQEQIESASIEGLALTNYNAATGDESAEPGGLASPSSALSSYHRPGHGHDGHDDEDDTFSFSSIIQFFKPAINAFGWLATLNPFSFGLFSIFLAPIVFLFAGTSGIAALFAPWAFSAREAPKVVHIHRPYWHWDDEIKTWHLHSFPNNRNWSPRYPRNSKEESTTKSSVKPTLFFKLKEFMKIAIEELRARNIKYTNSTDRKNKRKKRETWTIRIK